MNKPAGAHPDRSFIIAVLALLLVGTGIFLWRYGHMIQAGNAIPAEDFAFFYLAAQKVAQGHMADVYSLDSIHRYFDSMSHSGDHPFVHPPVMLLFLWPLGYLPVAHAATLWFAAQLLMLVATLAWLPKDYMPSLAEHPWQRGACLFLLALPSVMVDLMFGQTGIMTAALLITGAANSRTRPMASGMCFGALVIKPHLALLVPVALVAAKQWKTLTVAIITATALAGLSIWLWGWQLWQQCFAVWNVHAQIVQAGPPRLMQMMISAYAVLRQFGVGHQSAFLVQMACCVAVAFMVWNGFKRCHDDQLRASLLVAAGFVASPYIFAYDMPALILPLVLLAGHGMGDGLNGAERKFFILAGFVPLVAAQLGGMHIPAALLSSIGLSAVLYVRIWRNLP